MLPPVAWSILLLTVSNVSDRVFCELRVITTANTPNISPAIAFPFPAFFTNETIANINANLTFSIIFDLL